VKVSSAIYADGANNAATVTNGVYTSGSYADPAWITSLGGTKVSGDISGNAANITGDLAATQIAAGILPATVQASSVALGGFYNSTLVRSNLGLAIGTDVLAPTGNGSGLSGVVTAEADPVVKAINGLVKSNGAAISAAVAGADYVDIEEDPIVGAVSGLVKADGLGAISAAVAGTDYVVTEEDPIVGAVSGLVKADGAGAIAAATAGTDYLVPSSNGIPTYARVTTSDVTETGQALADITGLSVALAASAVYEFEANLSCAGDTGTDGNAYGVNFSGAAGATLEASLYAPPTSTTMKTERINALNTASSAYFTTASQSGGVLIKGIISTNGDTGNLTIKQLKVVSGTATVYVGSYLKVTRIN